MDRTVSQRTDGVVDATGTVATPDGELRGSQVPVAQAPVAQATMVPAPVAQATMVPAPVAQAPMVPAPVAQAPMVPAPVAQAHGPRAPGSRGCVCGHGEVMHLLAGHVPLSLLMDLALPAGPPSRDVLLVEGLPEESWWDGGDPAATRQTR
jgi:hypothetical protein